MFTVLTILICFVMISRESFKTYLIKRNRGLTLLHMRKMSFLSVFVSNTKFVKLNTSAISQTILLQ